MDTRILKAANSVTDAGSSCSSSPDPPDATPDLALAEGAESSADEGLKEIYKLISGSAGRATWNEIYAKLLANMQSTSAARQIIRNHDGKERQRKTMVWWDSRKPRRTNELKSRSGGAIRRQPVALSSEMPGSTSTTSSPLANPVSERRPR